MSGYTVNPSVVRLLGSAAWAHRIGGVTAGATSAPHMTHFIVG